MRLQITEELKRAMLDGELGDIIEVENVEKFGPTAEHGSRMTGKIKCDSVRIIRANGSIERVEFASKGRSLLFLNAPQLGDNDTLTIDGLDISASITME